MHLYRDESPCTYIPDRDISPFHAPPYNTYNAPIVHIISSADELWIHHIRSTMERTYQGLVFSCLRLLSGLDSWWQARIFFHLPSPSLGCAPGRAD